MEGGFSKMKFKLILVVALAVIGLSSGLLWLMDQKVTEEREAALEDGLRSSVNAISLAIQADLRGLRRTWNASSGLSRDHLDWKSLKPFVAIALVNFDAQSATVLQNYADPRGPASAWTANQWNQILSGWKKNTAPVDGASMSIVLDQDKNRYLAILWRDGDRNWLVVSTRELMKNMIDLQKGPHLTLALMNSQGRLIAHSTDEYVGTMASDGSIYKNILVDAGSRAYRRQTDGVSEPSVLAFEKVPRTDLTAVAFRPIAEIQAERKRILLFGSLAGLGLLLLSTSLVWVIARRWENEREEMLAAAYRTVPTKSVTAVGSPAAVTARPETATASASVKDRHDVALRIASALGHELRAPLISILGYSQMLLGSSADANVTEPVNSILKETREAREVLDKLLAFAGEKNLAKEDAKLSALVAKVLMDLEPRFRARQVTVKSEVPEGGKLSLSIASLENAFKQILLNAVESMDRMMKKEIHLSLVEEPTHFLLAIRDSGEGMDAETSAKALDPFFTTRNPAAHMGLGLSASYGILKEHGAEMKISSEKGKGTTVTMSFPKVAKSVSINNEIVQLRTEEKVEIPKDLPKAPATISAAAPATANSDLEDRTVVINQSPLDFDFEALLSPNEDSPKAAPVTAEKAEPPAGASASASATSPVEKAPEIAPPAFKSPKKPSRLEAVKVAIRRPGESTRGSH